MMKILLSLVLAFNFAYANQCNNALKKIKKVAGANPYKQALTATMKKQGKLQTRADQLAEKWPNNIKIVDDVKMHFEHENGTGTRGRKMIVISLKGLKQADKDLLLKDYVDYLSWNAIAFPMGEHGGHLYSRVGNKTIDYFGWFSQNDYHFPESERLETFVELSSQEFKNVRQYVENVDIDIEKVLGGNTEYDGAHPIANAALDKNKPGRGKGHNCTSWIATAPIGEDGSTLKNIVGAEEWDVHRNPGWWTAYIQTRGKNDRVPFVVYITNDSMTKALQKTNKEKFEWDYGLH